VPRSKGGATRKEKLTEFTCCKKDEGRPFALCLQEPGANHPELLG
jgi:hypothetical protein